MQMGILENLNWSIPFNFFVVETENKQYHKNRDRCEINTDKLEQLPLYLKTKKYYTKFIYPMHGFQFWLNISVFNKRHFEKRKGITFRIFIMRNNTNFLSSHKQFSYFFRKVLPCS